MDVEGWGPINMAGGRQLVLKTGLPTTGQSGTEKGRYVVFFGSGS